MDHGLDRLVGDIRDLHRFKKFKLKEKRNLKKYHIFSGMVLDKMVDFACGVFVMTRERMNDVDFLILRKSGLGRIYIRNPKDESDWKVYLKPLMKEAWIGILIFSAVIPVLMVLILMDSK